MHICCPMIRKNDLYSAAFATILALAPFQPVFARQFNPCNIDILSPERCIIRPCEYNGMPRVCALRSAANGSDLSVSVYRLNADDNFFSLRMTKRPEGSFFESEGGQIWRRNMIGRTEIFSALNYFGENGHQLKIFPEKADLAHRLKPWLGVFNPLPEAQFLCSQHTIGNDAGKRFNIYFELYSTTLPLLEALNFIAHANSVILTPEQRSITITKVSGRKKLTVLPNTHNFPKCGVRPDSRDGAVIIVSEISGPPLPNKSP